MVGRQRSTNRRRQRAWRGIAAVRAGLKPVHSRGIAAISGGLAELHLRACIPASGHSRSCLHWQEHERGRDGDESGCRTSVAMSRCRHIFNPQAGLAAALVLAAVDVHTAGESRRIDTRGEGPVAGSRQPNLLHESASTGGAWPGTGLEQPWGERALAGFATHMTGDLTRPGAALRTGHGPPRTPR